MDKIPDKIDSKFRYVLLASHRAEQLMRGAPPRVERPGSTLTRTAMEEVMEELIEWDYGPAPVEEPPATEETSEEGAVAEGEAAEADAAAESAPAEAAEASETAES